MTGQVRARALLDWYGRHRRTLPWRRHDGPADPYAVLVSELMLQQTRVETVIPYFTRWMNRWPTVASLACAPVDEVLEAWSGLGYYSRARNLHRAATVVVEQHSGRLPSDKKSLAALPGVGPYTVGALLSIGFGLPAALVDGNVSRVLSRWFALRAPPATSKAKKTLWSLASELSIGEHAVRDPSSWSQSLMELGATLCKPRNPLCPQCPVSSWCRAFDLHLTDVIPAKTPKKAPVQVEAVYVLLTRADGALWLARRPDTGRWAGLWEPPGVEGVDARDKLLGTIAVALDVNSHAPIKHVLTHRRYRITPLSAHWSATQSPELGALGYVDGRWWHPNEKKSPALSRLATKLVDLVTQSHTQLDLLPLASGPERGSDSVA